MASEFYFIVTVIPNTDSMTEEEAMEEVKWSVMDSDAFKGGSIQRADKLKGKGA